MPAEGRVDIPAGRVPDDEAEAEEETADPSVLNALATAETEPIGVI
jgi:hypothetical protein